MARDATDPRPRPNPRKATAAAAVGIPPLMTAGGITFAEWSDAERLAAKTQITAGALASPPATDAGRTQPARTSPTP